MAFQALYRRYRPQRFGEVKGQDHVVAALRNAVRDDGVGHAYLFSGPRGTGKTSTARILAKALNCEALDGGEPCGTCESCRSVEAGTSMAVIELDAASNNGVDAMRELIQRASLTSSGRTKVYIVDEVHMLSSGASNALLKTLEEPPPGVVFVLATTDPHKVLPTLRSRTQHFDFHLLGAGLLGEHLRSVVADAGLDLSDAAIDRAVRKGDGSARDALSALDQIAAAGGEGEDDASIDEVVEGLCEHDTARALGGVAAACGAGADPRSIASAIAAHLRDALLSLLAPDLVSLPDAVRERVADQARRLGPAALVRALDALGDAVLALPNAPDPRVTLEVALVKVTKPEADSSTGAILERLERLERADRKATTAAVEASTPLPVVAPEAPTPPARTEERPRPARSGAAGAAAARDALTAAAGHEAPPAPDPGPPGEAVPDGGAPSHGQPAPASPASRPALGSVRKAGARREDARREDARREDARREDVAPASDDGAGTPGPAVTAASAPDAATSSAAPVAGSEPAGTVEEARDSPPPPGRHLPDLAAVVAAWEGQVLPLLSSVTKGRFSTGRPAEVAADALVVSFPSRIMCDLCAERRPELERALAQVFGHPVPVRLVVDEVAAPVPSGSAAPAPADEGVDLDDLVDAPDDHRTGVDRLTEAFPGAEVLDGG